LIFPDISDILHPVVVGNSNSWLFLFIYLVLYLDHYILMFFMFLQSRKEKTPHPLEYIALSLLNTYSFFAVVE